MTAVEKDVTVVEKLCGKGVTCRKKGVAFAEKGVRLSLIHI